MNTELDPDEMACRAAEPIAHDYDDFVECVACGTRVRWDLADHGFFGFAAGCPHKHEQQDGGQR